MPILALFHDSSNGDRVAFSPDVLRQHETHIRQLHAADQVRSFRDLSSTHDPRAVGNGNTYGYILNCSTIDEAETIARKDPLWTLSGNNIQLLPWSFGESVDDMNSAPHAQSGQIPARRFDPIFPITNMDRSLRHYTTLGFEPEAYDNQYAFVTLPGIGCIHFTLQSDHDPKINAAATYLYVDDADALAAKWRRDCPQGDTREPVDTDYGLREGAHLDPDNNLIRFGSEMKAK